MAKHTEGQWEVRDGYGQLKSEVGPAGRAVATVWTKRASTREEQKEPVAWPEGEANARLIATAPDMLAALRLYVSAGFGQSTDPHQQGEAYDAAIAAIARAEGTPE